jgi:dipeptidyl aminopeptidase/acylaminoacyl peptidase
MSLRILGLSLMAVAAIPNAARAQRAAVPARETFALAQVLSAPFAAELVAGPDGRSVAWMGDVEGLRNVYVAEAPAWQARPLTRYTADDGQEIGGLVWTRDGRGVLFVRGGDRSAAGEVPNPTSSPRGALQEVWLASLTGGAPRRVGEGTSPTPAPTGERVAFLLRDTAWVAPLGTIGPARILFRARGITSGLAWAPDGTRLAFTSQRGDHAFIGVYDLSRDTIRYLAPSVDRDAAPAWSPDGRQLAFVRMSGALSGPAPASGNALPPWTIWVADAETGEGREVWRAPVTLEGAAPVVDGDGGLWWSADDRLVFAGEMGGWRGLYAVSPRGGEAMRLTPPDCEVESAVFEADHRGFLYTSNCGDSERRHVARVAASGTAPLPLSGGQTVDWSPQPLAEGGFAFLSADARRPGAPIVVARPGGERERVSGFDPAPAFPAGWLVEPQFVSVRAADSLDVRMQLFLPPGGAAGRRPAVIFFHGGPSRQMLLGWHYMYYYHNAYAFNQYLASRGFVVLSVNYRGGIGYGRDFRQAPRRGMRGASEYLDVLAAAAWLRARPDVDSTRIGLWGGSYGGYLTALGLARNSDLFAAGVDLHGVHDWSLDRGVPVGARAPRPADSVLALWRASSPVADVERWRSPVLLIQGDDDRNVSFSQTVDLAQRLRRQGVETRLLVFPDDVHDFLRHAHWLAAYTAGAEFLIAKLMPGGN